MDAAALDSDLEDSGYSSNGDVGNDCLLIAPHAHASSSGMVSLSFMRTDSGPVSLNAFRSHSGNIPDEFQLGIAGDDSLALDAFDSPSLASDEVPSKSGRNRSRRPLQEAPLRSFSFSSYGAGLHPNPLESQFLAEDSDFDESSYYSSDSSSTSAGAKRKRDSIDSTLYVSNNNELSSMCSESSSPPASSANTKSQVSWVRSRGKSGQFLGWGEVETRISMSLDKSTCVTKRIAIITRRSRNEICGILNSSDDDAEVFSNYSKVSNMCRTLKVPPPSPDVLPASGNVMRSLSRSGRGKLSLDNLRNVLGKSDEEPARSPWVAPSDSNFQCAYELCPYPTKSSGSWKTVTKDTTAGQRDWLPYIGLTFCHACWTQFRTRGTLERLGRRADELPPPPTNDVIRVPVTVPPKSPRLPASSPRLDSSCLKTKGQSPAITSRGTPSMTPKASKSQSPALKPIGSPAIAPKKMPPNSHQEPNVAAKAPKPSTGRVRSGAEHSTPTLGSSPRPPVSPFSSEAVASPRGLRSADMEPLVLPKRQLSGSSPKQ